MTQCHPILVLHPNHYICDIHGKQLGKDPKNSQGKNLDWLNIAVIQGRYFTAFCDETKDAETKAHTLQYQGRTLCAKVEDSLKNGWFAVGKETFNFLPTVLQERLLAHYQAHPRAITTRNGMIQEFLFEAWDTIKCDHEIEINTHVFGAHSANKESLNANIHTIYARLPDWMQVLVEEYGCIAICNVEHAYLNGYSGSAITGRENPFAILLNPESFDFPEKTQHQETLQIEYEDAERLLFEEIMHVLHEHIEISPQTQRKNKWAVNAWIKAADKTLLEIYGDSTNSQALALIKETEPDGGSLMSPVMQSKSTQRTELLVDMCEVEKYLRREKGLGAPHVKAEMQRKFGEETYAGYSAILRGLIEEAAVIKSSQVGTRSAQYYEQLWLRDPFHILQRDKGFAR